MFSVPLPSGMQALMQQGVKPGEGVGGRLLEVLASADDLQSAFPAELQTLLLNMTPQMLQRLESMVAGGIELPRAARQLLGEFAASPASGGPGDRALPVLEANNDGKLDLPAFAKAVALPQVTKLVTVPGIAEEMGMGVSVSGAKPPGLDASFRTVLSPQLTSSLLDMGLPQPVGSRNWPGALAERVVWMAQGEQQFARLTLNPPHLGPLEVRVSVNQDQASVTFVAAHAAVRDALEAAMPRLREMLDQQSMDLVHAEVADPGAQRRETDDDHEARSPVHGSVDQPGHASDDDGGAVHSPLVSVGRGLIDLFA